ncbi:MAG: LPS export ABC transporter permease LptG [Mangrovicoccus sp.]
MKLHLYFAQRYLSMFLMILAGFTLFMYLVELLEHIRRFDAGHLGFPQLAYLALLHLPQVVYQILTLVILLASVALFITLSRTNELVISRATGRSALASLMAPVFAALAIGIFMVAVANPMVATSSKLYEQEVNLVRGKKQVFSVSREGLWLRQGSETGQTAIRARRTNEDGTQLFNVSFFGFDENGQATYRIEAAQAELLPGKWDIRNAKRWNFVDTVNPETQAIAESQTFIPSDLTVEQIRDSFGSPSTISIWDLPAFIAQLTQAGFSTRNHQVWLNAELARPLGFVAMVFIGSVFTLRHTRMGRTGLMVLLAVLTGFLVYFIGNLAQLMGQNGQLPIALAVWTTPVAAILLALGLLLHFEDG